jgi:dienelactone hydrolase
MRTALFLALILATASSAQQHPIDLIKADATLLQPPRFEAAPAEFKVADPTIRAILFDAKPYQGKPTKTFAYLGLPDGAGPGKKVPAVVLIHGGGGTAFDRWVKVWTARGYAAIAMDNCGAFPVKSEDPKQKGWRRNPQGGPPGWDASFTQMDAPITDQWQYHALSDILLAHSLIRSLPEVDAERVGVTGISWGGYLTCLTVGVDARFKFAVPVYGCGFYDECVWQPTLEKMPPEKSKQWLDQWDPRHYLKGATTPMLWVTGTNDFAYPFGALQKSYRLPRGERTLSVTLRMPHGHGPAGENPEVIRAFADSVFLNGAPLPVITAQGRDETGRTAWATFTAKTAVTKAELLYTADTGPWQKRLWKAVPAAVGDDYKASAAIPPGTKVYYLNLIDEHGIPVSTEHVEVP